MANYIDLCEQLSIRYGIELSPATIQNANYEHQQTLGQLFTKIDCLYKLKKQFKNYIDAKMRCVQAETHDTIPLIDSVQLSKLISLVKTLEIHKFDSQILPETIISKIKDQSLSYLHTKLQLERTIATKQRILLLIAEKTQMIKKLKKLCSEKEGRNLGDLKEKELCQLLQSVQHLRQKIAIDKQNLDKQ